MTQATLAKDIASRTYISAIELGRQPEVDRRKTGRAELSVGAILQSTLSYTLASDAYARSKQLRKAWACRYAAAFALYQAGHMDQAISLGVDAVNLLCDSEECEARALTHYMIGCAYFAKGDVKKASSFLDTVYADLSRKQA